MRTAGPALLALAVIATVAAVWPADAQAQLAVDTSPATLITSLEAAGEVQLQMPVGATRFSDGTIVVADAAMQTVSYFDATGRRVRVAGRQGAGPGEFNGLSWAGQCGVDSITVWDRANNRLTVFDAKGELARESTLQLEPAVAGRAAFTTCARSGALAFVSLPLQMDPNSRVQRGEAMVTLLPAGGTAHRVGSDINSSEVVVLGGGGVGRPLGLTTTAAIAGDRIYIGTGDSAAVVVYTLSGEAAGSIAVPGASRRAVRSDQYEAAVDELLQMVPSGAVPMVHSALMELPRATRLPAYNSIHTDTRGILWLVQSAPGDPTRLFAVDAHGRAIGQIELPLQLTVWEIGEDFILGQYTGELGEPFIASFTLRR